MERKVYTSSVTTIKIVFKTIYSINPFYRLLLAPFRNYLGICIHVESLPVLRNISAMNSILGLKLRPNPFMQRAHGVGLWNDLISLLHYNHKPLQ